MNAGPRGKGVDLWGGKGGDLLNLKRGPNSMDKNERNPSRAEGGESSRCIKVEIESRVSGEKRVNLL